MTIGKTHTYSDAEWRARVDLAAAYRLTDHFGMTSLIYNHITARVPGTDDQFLINEYGLGYDEVAASNLLKLDMDGNILEEGEHRINYTGYVIHSAVHAARHDVTCVMHTHTPYGMACPRWRRACCSYSRRATSSMSASRTTISREWRSTWTSGSGW